MEQVEKKKGFVVRDKRSREEMGEIPKVEEEGAQSVKTFEQTADARTPSSDKEKPRPESEEGAEFLTEVNFYNFILSLSTSAIYHFGDIPDPETKTTQRNLAAAKHTIDILAMLKEKTRGNLEEHEKNLLEGILFELKMRYVREKALK